VTRLSVVLLIGIVEIPEDGTEPAYLSASRREPMVHALAQDSGRRKAGRKYWMNRAQRRQ
jgi:hypothetical protein